MKRALQSGQYIYDVTEEEFNTARKLWYTMCRYEELGETREHNEAVKEYEAFISKIISERDGKLIDFHNPRIVLPKY